MEYMYRAILCYVVILMKIYLTLFMIGCFIVGFLLVGVNCGPFFVLCRDVVTFHLWGR